MGDFPNTRGPDGSGGRPAASSEGPPPRDVQKESGAQLGVGLQGGGVFDLPYFDPEPTRHTGLLGGIQARVRHFLFSENILVDVVVGLGTSSLKNRGRTNGLDWISTILPRPSLQLGTEVGFCPNPAICLVLGADASYQVLVTPEQGGAHRQGLQRPGVGAEAAEGGDIVSAGGLVGIASNLGPVYIGAYLHHGYWFVNPRQGPAIDFQSPGAQVALTYFFDKFGREEEAAGPHPTEPRWKGEETKSPAPKPAAPQPRADSLGAPAKPEELALEETAPLAVVVEDPVDKLRQFLLAVVDDQTPTLEGQAREAVQGFASGPLWEGFFPKNQTWPPESLDSQWLEVVTPHLLRIAGIAGALEAIVRVLNVLSDRTDYVPRAVVDTFKMKADIILKDPLNTLPGLEGEERDFLKKFRQALPEGYRPLVARSDGGKVSGLVLAYLGKGGESGPDLVRFSAFVDGIADVPSLQALEKALAIPKMSDQKMNPAALGDLVRAAIQKREDQQRGAVEEKKASLREGLVASLPEARLVENADRAQGVEAVVAALSEGPLTPERAKLLADQFANDLEFMDQMITALQGMRRAGSEEPLIPPESMEVLKKRFEEEKAKQGPGIDKSLEGLRFLLAAADPMFALYLSSDDPAEEMQRDYMLDDLRDKILGRKRERGYVSRITHDDVRRLTVWSYQDPGFLAALGEALAAFDPSLSGRFVEKGVPELLQKVSEYLKLRRPIRFHEVAVPTDANWSPGFSITATVYTSDDERLRSDLKDASFFLGVARDFVVKGDFGEEGDLMVLSIEGADLAFDSKGYLEKATFQAVSLDHPLLGAPEIGIPEVEFGERIKKFTTYLANLLRQKVVLDRASISGPTVVHVLLDWKMKPKKEEARPPRPPRKPLETK